MYEKVKPQLQRLPLTTTGLVWSEDGGANKTADSAFFIFGTGGNNASYITAYKDTGANGRLLELNLDSNTTSTYAIPAHGDFVFWKGGVANMATGGSVVVTANTGGKATGTFDVTFTGTPAHVKGTFTNITIK
jgi:hypothetical protein